MSAPKPAQNPPTVSRRSILAGCAAVAATVGPKPAQAAPDSPIMLLYGQWHVVRDQINSAGNDASTEDRLYATMEEIENQIWLLPCTTAADLAAKYYVQTDCGGFYADEKFGDECKALLGRVLWK